MDFEIYRSWGIEIEVELKSKFTEARLRFLRGGIRVAKEGRSPSNLDYTCSERQRKKFLGNEKYLSGLYRKVKNLYKPV